MAFRRIPSLLKTLDSFRSPSSGARGFNTLVSTHTAKWMQVVEASVVIVCDQTIVAVPFAAALLVLLRHRTQPAIYRLLGHFHIFACELHSWVVILGATAAKLLY